jgi:hypothetical protein
MSMTRAAVLCGVVQCFLCVAAMGSAEEKAQKQHITA